MTRNPFGWDYPAGAEHDPRAPYNQPDPPDFDDYRDEAVDRAVEDCEESGRHADVILRMLEDDNRRGLLEDALLDLGHAALTGNDLDLCEAKDRFRSTVRRWAESHVDAWDDTAKADFANDRAAETENDDADFPDEE